MKWALLAVAAAALWVCWELGQPLYSNQSANSAAHVGMVMAGLIGVMSVIGAALIHASENKRKE